MIFYLEIARQKGMGLRENEYDLPASLRVCVVSKVSLRDQKLITGTPGTICDIVRQQGVETPAVFFIGEHTVPAGKLFLESSSYDESGVNRK